MSGVISIGFPFVFYGQTYSTLTISSNGYLQLAPLQGYDQYGGCCNGQHLPDASAPNGLVAAYWTDLYPRGGGTVKWQVLGEAPDREFVAQWTIVPHYCCYSYPVSTEIVLHEGTSAIDVQARSAQHDGHVHVTGVEDPAGTSGITYHYGQYDMIQEGVRFLPPGIASAPQNVQLSLEGRNATLAWDAPAFTGDAAVESYRVVRSDDAGGDTVSFSVTDGTTFVDADLARGVTYAYTVSAVTTLGEGVHSAPQSVTIPAVRPPLPTISFVPPSPNGLGGYYNTSITAEVGAIDQGDGLDPASIAYSFDDATYTNGSSVAVDDSTPEIWAHASTPAGDVGALGPVFVSIDTTPPLAQIVDLRDSAANATAVLSIAFSEPMDPDATVAALEGADGLTPAWNEPPRDEGEGAQAFVDVLPHSILTLTGGPLGEGPHTIVLGTGARDAHGVHLADPVTFTYDVDQHGPEFGALDVQPTPVLAGDVVTLRIPIADALTGVDASTAQILVDGKAIPTTFEDGVAIAATTLTDLGSHPVAVSASDQAGNANASDAGAVDVRSRDPPVTTLASPDPDGAEGWYVTAPRVTLEASPPQATIAWRLDDGADAPYEGPIEIPAGTHELRYHATAPGHPDEVEQAATFRVDVEAPVLGVAALDPASPRIGDPVTIHVPVSDGGSGVAGATISADGVDLPTSLVDDVATATFTPTAIGRVAFAARATDRAGNAIDGDAGAVDVRPHEAPSTSLTVADPDGSDGWYRTLPAVTLTAEPAGSDVTYAIDSGDRQPYDGPITLPAGVHTLHYGATAADSETEPDRSATFRVDDAAPTLGALAQDPSDPRVGDTVQLSIPVADADGSGVASAVFRAGGSTLDTAVVDGVARATFLAATATSYDVHVDVTDAAGNVASQDLASVAVSPRPPPSTTLAVADATGRDGWYLAAPSVSLASDPSNATIHVAIDGAAETDYAGAFTIPPGIHTLSFRATAEGYEDEPAHTVTFRVDADAPSHGALAVDAASPRAGEPVHLTIPVSDATSGVASVVLRADGVALPTALVGGTASATYAASGPGTVHFDATVTDAAGNGASAPVGSQLFRPRPAPVTSLAAPAPTGLEGWYLAPPAVTLAAEPGGMTIHYAIDGGAETDYAGAFTIPAGTHALSYRSSAEGYDDEAPRSATFRVDAAAPVFGALTLDPASPQAWRPLTIHVAVSDADSGVASATLTVNGAPLATALADGVATATYTPQTTDRLAFGATATDRAGNARSQDLGASDVRPRPPPETTLHVAAPDGDHGWYQAPPNVALTATPSDASIAYALDGGAETPYQGSFRMPTGVHDLSYHASAPSSQAEAPHATTIRVDGTPPDVGTASAPLAVIVGQDVTVGAPVSDALSGLANVTILADGVDLATAIQDGVATATYTTNAVGDLTFTLRARDVAGNVRALPIATVNVQPIPPRFASAPGAPVAALVDGHVHLAWSPPTDPGAPGFTSYHLYRDGALLGSPAGASFDDLTAERGRSYAYSVAAVSGREGARSGVTTFAVPAPDPGASDATVVPPAPDGADGWYATAPVVTLAATPDDARVRYRLDDGPLADYASPVAVPDGHHTLRWFATRAGAANESERSRSFDVDATPPTIASATLSAPNATVGRGVVLTVHANDTGSGIASVVARLSDGTDVTLGAADDAFVATLAPPTVGPYDVIVTATDLAGHMTSAGAGHFTVDAVVVPETNLTAAENATGNATEPTPTPVAVGNSTNGDGGTNLERTSVGGSGSSGSGGAGSGPGPASTTPRPAPPAPVVVVTQGDPTLSLDAGARGTIDIEVQNAPHPERIRFVAIASDGTETQIGSGRNTTWDTTQEKDGYYTVEAREQREDGTTFTIASARVHVRNVFDTIGQAAATAAVGVGVGAAASVAATALTSTAATTATSTAASATSAVATSSGGSQGFNLIQYLKDLVSDAGSDALRDRTKDVASIERRRRIRSAVSLGVTVALIAVFYSVAESSPITMGNVLASLPIVGAAAVVLALQKYGSESAIAHLSGARVRFRIWVAGVLSVLVSTLVFRSPFGYPGYVDNGEEHTAAEKRKAGLRALAILGVTSAWGLVFLAAAHLGYYTFGTVGIAMALTALATAAMPFGPLAGAEVWRWNKAISVLCAIVAMAMYVTYEMAILPEIVYVAIGVIGAVGYAITALYYRRHKAPPHRVPVQDMDAERAAAKPEGETVEKAN